MNQNDPPTEHIPVSYTHLVAGTRQIERIVRKKILGKLDAVKGDVHKAYPSTTIACVITLLKLSLIHI